MFKLLGDALTPQQNLALSTIAFLAIALRGLSGSLQKVAARRVSGAAAALVCLGAFVPIGVAHGLREPWLVDLSWRNWLVVGALGFFLALGNVTVLATCAARSLLKQSNAQPLPA